MFKGSLERNNFFDIVQVNKFSNFLENFLHAQDINWQAMFSRQILMLIEYTEFISC
jgi:hypothetical protein